ncbi:uncharacterized protein LOC142983835 isoform X2 [Anticarsia gemmatalis]|uniref:uncharacterized protein LOC142983835 isoform X2 n=1 Tax=Anticarsia gemmatalis TaxID=129554 RepID=UPI003F771E7A
MMKCFVLCIVILALGSCAYASFGNDMAETIQMCCNDGNQFARNHTATECIGNIPPTPGVSAGLMALCVMAKEKCCGDYFRVKTECDSGVDMSISSNNCESLNGMGKVCCDECSQGAAIGTSSGPNACQKIVIGSNSEELLRRDAFLKCCEKASQFYKESSSQRSPGPITLATLPSTCEEYAPNELCAHHCIPVPGSYRCECNPGFMLMADRRNCKKVSKNRCKPRNHCQHKCNDNGVEVKCSCRRGYELMPDGKSCQDIDECQQDMRVCPNSACINLPGSYRCKPKKKKNEERGQCPTGYIKNVNTNFCDDINECLLPQPPCPEYMCENTIGGFLCGGVSGDQYNVSAGPHPGDEDRCPPGFRVGANEECEDVDECAMKKHECNLLSQFCINTHGSFYCQDKSSKYCPPGFKLSLATGICEDINECEEDNVCQHDQICVNQLGRYDCKANVDSTRDPSACPEGLRKNTKTLLCEDVDECRENAHVCKANQNCLNTHGGYECHCKLGYELDINSETCVDLNECATGQHDCIPQAQRCDNTVGSYLCVRIASCGTGYVLEHGTGSCEDIDECALGVHNCGAGYSCFNIRGSFRCVRRRPSTTSTTLDPNYEYYYDDSEEEEGNGTSSTAEPTTTSTTARPEAPTTKRTEKEENNIEPPTLPTDIHYSEPNNTDLSETKPVLVIPEPPELPPKPEIPEQPKPTEAQPVTTVSIEPTVQEPTVHEPVPTVQEPQPTEQQTETIPTERLPSPVPATPPPRVDIPPEIPEEELPREPESRLLIPETNNETIPPETESRPETTYTPIPSTTGQSSPTFVNVNAGKETATVAGTVKEDGSVVINTADVPKNNWAKVNVKPLECPYGYEPDEYGACFDIDECATQRHSCSGLTEICRNTIGGYTCTCAPGFRRDLITMACDVITTTSSTTTTTAPPPPVSNGNKYFWDYHEYRPTQRPFRPRNRCDSGYHYNFQTFKCEDINECTNGQANCAVVEVCVNTEGGYKCECPPNWRLDDVRHRCVPNNKYGQFPPGYANEPTSSTVPPQVNIPASPGTKYVDPQITQIENSGSIFKCPQGYSLAADNTCVDVNECLTGEAKCGPIQICTNLPGGYSCNCPTGHRLIGDHMCEDVDECAAAGNLPICSQNADCVNTIGSYQCKCHNGFVSAPVNDKVCVDVDECTAARPGSLCQHRCNNVWGGYRCSCHRGYRLNRDNSTCSDIDECVEFKSKVPCIGRCINEPGSYRCACPKGYKLSEDKRSCIDIDECETGEALCSTSISSDTSNDVCVNTRGSFRCHRITCPVGYRLKNKHRCTREEQECLPGDWNCTRQPTTISYNFITFVSNLYIPDGKLKLFTMKGPVWTNAKMRFELRLVDVNAPPSVKKKADINDFLLTQQTNFEGLMSLVRPLEGPQSVELEMSMEVYIDGQFGGTAIAKLYIYVSEYEY